MDAGVIASRLLVILVIVALAPLDRVFAAGATCHIFGTVRHTPNNGTAQDVANDVLCNDGDLLEAVDADSRMELRCPSGGPMVFDKGFRAFIISVDAAVCAINLRAGNAFATTPPDSNEACEPGANPKTRIEVASAVAGACGTRFGVEVSQESIQAAYVVEGTALVRTAAGDQLIKTGTELRPAVNQIVKIPDARLYSLATTYAVLSQSEAGATVSPDSQKQLQAAYYYVFREPYNATRRAALVEVQRRAAVMGVAQKYDHTRADRLVKNSNDAVLQANWSKVLATTPAIATTKRFDYPRHNGYRVDICRVWGQECNQPAADQWCQTRGYASAASFTLDADIGATDASITIGSGQVCSESYCDAFRSIDCRGPARPTSLTFPNPTYLGRRLDICLHWGVDCGQPAAAAWCAQQGFEHATGLSYAQNVGQVTPTIVLGDNKVCALPECDAFASITCTR